MRIRRLEIAQFRNLTDFRMEFDPTSHTTVIVGRNGTGKSNILEAVAIIFRNLDLDRDPEFKFSIEYDIAEFRVAIAGDPEKASHRYTFKVDNNSVPRKDFLGADDLAASPYLPRFVFGYYSGSSTRLEEIFREHQRRFLRDIIEGEPAPLRRFLFGRAIHGILVMLAFFNELNDSKIESSGANNFEILNEVLGLPSLGFDSALFVLRKPQSSSRKVNGDPRFWNPPAAIGGFLSNLYAAALAPLRIQHEASDVTALSRRNTEHLYLYIPSLAVLRELGYGYTTPQEFFRALEAAHVAGILNDVRLRIALQEEGGQITFQELSEGEQQLLLVLGLLRFTQEKEALFLLDEPDTHLNPAWSMQYLDVVDKVVGSDPTSHIIMTTHSPIVLATLNASELRVLERNSETGQIELHTPQRDPSSMGYAEILTSDIFGLRSILSPQIQRELSEMRNLQLIPEEDRTEEEQKRIRFLASLVEHYDLTSTVRDPMYEPFVRAMTKIEKEKELDSPLLSLEERQKREDEALEFLRRNVDAK